MSGGHFEYSQYLVHEIAEDENEQWAGYQAVDEREWREEARPSPSEIFKRMKGDYYYE